MTAVADPLDVHIPRSNSHGHNKAPIRPDAGSRSRSSRSFFQALNSIDMSERIGQSSSDLSPSLAPARRKHHSFNIEGDEYPDAAALIQNIMSSGIVEKPERSSSFGIGKQGTHRHKRGSSFSLPKKQSSFHIPERQSSFHHVGASPEPERVVVKGTSVHTETSSVTNPTDASDQPVPAFPLPTSKSRKSHRPIERKPIDPPIEDHRPHNDLSFRDSIDKNSHGQTMQVIDLLWHDLLGVPGKYSGQVNSHIQPHGFGSLVRADGTTVTCKWYNGTPIDRRRSDCGPLKKVERRTTSRRSSDKTHERSDLYHHHHHHVLDESARTNGSGAHAHDLDYKKSISEPVKPPKQSQRPSYALGDAPLSHSHVAAPKSMKRAIESADSLKIHDFAFVLRSNGEWCYSIVAKKNPPSEKKGEDGGIVKNFEDAYILFVTDTRGSTKCIKMKHWGKMIRLVNL